MPRYRSLDEIFEEPDEYGLLEVKVRTGAASSSPESRNIEIVVQVNAFFEAHGRLPSDDSLDIEEMKLGTIWQTINTAPTPAMLEADCNTLLESVIEDSQAGADEPRDWRDDPLDDEIPASLDDLLGDDEVDYVHEAAVNIRNVTPAAMRETPEHRADLHQCHDFDRFEEGFAEMQARLDGGERVASPIEEREEINVTEGDHFIHRGLLAYVAEKTELSRRGGKPDHRLRIVFSNGMEFDPLISSFRKALASDRTARLIHRPGFGPLDPEWSEDKMLVTGTVYVARSLSDDPAIKEVRNILHKVGVTSQDVRRRIADAKNDPTFLMAPVEIVATYELQNMERSKVENVLHRFFDEARPSELAIADRFGKKVHPREWFYVLPEHVSRAVDLIRQRTLHLFRYDPTTQNILEVDDEQGDAIGRV